MLCLWIGDLENNKAASGREINHPLKPEENKTLSCEYIEGKKGGGAFIQNTIMLLFPKSSLSFSLFCPRIKTW